MLIVSFKVWPYHRFPVYCELGKHMHTLEEHGGCGGYLEATCEKRFQEGCRTISARLDWCLQLFWRRPFLEVNPSLSTATIPDEKPSLSTANSWKEVYKSETFWKKQLVSRLWAWPDCLDEDLFDFWVITSWELTCKKLLSELKMTCYTRKGVFKHVWIFEPYKIPDWQ